MRAATALGAIPSLLSFLPRASRLGFGAVPGGARPTTASGSRRSTRSPWASRSWMSSRRLHAGTRLEWRSTSAIGRRSRAASVQITHLASQGGPIGRPSGPPHRRAARRVRRQRSSRIEVLVARRLTPGFKEAIEVLPQPDGDASSKDASTPRLFGYLRLRPAGCASRPAADSPPRGRP